MPTKTLFIFMLGLFFSLWVLEAKAESKSCDAEAAAIENFDRTLAPVKLADHELSTINGDPIQLTRYRGLVIVLNHWATWCAPCIHEMPTFERLAVQTKEDPIAIVALSMDRSGPAKVGEFMERQGWEKSIFLSDKAMKMGREYAIRTIPTTQVFQRDGQEYGRLAGTFEWDKPEVIALLTCLSKMD